MISRRLLLAGLMLTGCKRKESAAASGTVTIGGPFALTDQNGKPVTQEVLKGRWTAVYFAFTYCPDVCPLTLQTLKAAKDKLGRKGAALQVVFITLDPARDTPAQMKLYLDNAAFPAGTIGLTGTPEQIDAVARAYRQYYAKNGDGEDYLIDHASVVYLMNPKGEFDRPLTHGLSPEEMAAQIRNAMG